MSTQPLALLKGVRVLSFTQFLMGPAGVQYLADMGADVIKIEPPGAGAWERTWAGGETFLNGVSAFFLLSHRNNRSLTLNLKHPEGQAIAHRLIAEADVLVQNFRPGVMERFGLGYEDVRSLNPRLIYVSASGYGEDGPARDLPGQDLLLQAMSGLAAITGRDGEIPTPAGAPVVDQHGAALLAMGVVAALFNRERSGQGQKVSVNMVQAALDLQLEPISYYLNGLDVRRSESGLATGFHAAPYGVYQTRDGYVALSMSPVAALRTAMQLEELASYEEPRVAMEQRDEIRRLLEPVLRRETTAHWLDLLRRHGIWVAPVNTYREVLVDPAVQHLNPVISVQHPVAGQVNMLRLPLRFSSGEPEVTRVPPMVGEHTEEILLGLGYSDVDVRRLRDERVV